MKKDEPRNDDQLVSAQDQEQVLEKMSQLRTDLILKLLNLRVAIANLLLDPRSDLVHVGFSAELVQLRLCDFDVASDATQITADAERAKRALP
jgi:hypothetical protein